jgi:hypothetical protein
MLNSHQVLIPTSAPTSQPQLSPPPENFPQFSPKFPTPTSIRPPSLPRPTTPWHHTHAPARNEPNLPTPAPTMSQNAPQCPNATNAFPISPLPLSHLCQISKRTQPNCAIPSHPSTPAQNKATAPPSQRDQTQQPNTTSRQTSPHPAPSCPPFVPLFSHPCPLPPPTLTCANL